MAGHMGARNTSVLNLLVVQSDPIRNLIFVEGSVPGPNKGLVTVTPARKPARSDFEPPELPEPLEPPEPAAMEPEPEPEETVAVADEAAEAGSEDEATEDGAAETTAEDEAETAEASEGEEEQE